MNPILQDTANTNLETLRTNPYPGRGIGVGVSDDGKHFVQFCWLTGRSDESRNRRYRFDLKTGRLYTEAADPSKLKDPTNIIYDAMLEKRNVYVVSNGVQTNGIVQSLGLWQNFYETMFPWKYESDTIATPRIAAICDLETAYEAQFCIVRKSSYGDACERHYYCYEKLPLGCGYCLTTYSDDGNPPPHFHGEPYLLPLNGTIVDVAFTLWRALNEDNRISLAVKFINKDSGKSWIRVVNKHAALT